MDSLSATAVTQVLDLFPACACVVDDGKIYLNRAAEIVTGYDRAEFSSLTEFLDKTGASPVSSFQVAAPLPGAPVAELPAAEVALSCKDGTRSSFRLTWSAPEQGRRFGYLCPLPDPSAPASPELAAAPAEPAGDHGCGITEQKLVEREALLRAIIESLPFDFFALDRQGRYTLLNSSVARGNMIGKTVQEFAVGTPYERHIPKWLECNARALAGETITGECRFEWRGTERICSEILVPIRDPQQNILGIFGINIDITEQKRTQQALEESEERYRSLSGLTSDYVYCCTRTGDEHFRIKWLGGAVEEITGYSKAEIFESGCWMSYVHPEDRDRVAAQLLCLEPGDQATDEFRLICKNGEICWIRHSARCEAGDAEGELRLYGASQNITQSKDAEIALKNVEEIFRLFLEHSPAYLVFKDHNHKVLRLSRNFERMLGRPLEEMVGKTAAELYSKHTAERIWKDDQRVLTSGRPTQSEEEVNGRFYSCFKFLIPQKNKATVLAAIKTDITARRVAEDALCELNERLDRAVAERTAQLEASIREQEAFSYSVSHDLRAPLRHINSFSSILLEDYAEHLPTLARDYLRRICGATRRMGLLIDNLLKLSRVSRTVIKRNSVNLSEMVAETALMLKEIEPERGVQFSIAPSVYAECDKVLIRQLFENLVGNAWKYTASSSQALIEFGVMETERDTVYFVKDNGVGFNMSYQEKLFIPFQRLHGAEFEGDGIGLATVQRIVRGHGGRIWAEGSEGEGAQFYFTLGEGKAGARD